MEKGHEWRQRYETNPSSISSEVVDSLAQHLTGNLTTDRDQFDALFGEHPDIKEFNHPMFIGMRTSTLVISIQRDGQDDLESGYEGEGYENGDESACLVRSYAITAFDAEAKKQLLPQPRANSNLLLDDDLILPVIFEDELPKMKGPKGLKVVNATKLLTQLKENKPFFDGIGAFVKGMATFNTQATANEQDLSDSEAMLLLEKWKEVLLREVLMVYGWFSPKAPEILTLGEQNL